MTRVEELTNELADDTLSDEQARELQGLLAQSEQAREVHIRMLQIEAGLRARRQNLDLAPAIMAWLRARMAESITQGVMSEIRAQPMPKRGRHGALKTDSAGRASRLFRFLFLIGGSRWSLKPGLLALAACVVLVAGVWFFGPTRGEPALAEVQGAGLSVERAGLSIPAVIGAHLQSGDVLRTPETVTAVIGFAPENTRLTVKPGTELTLTDMSHGKRMTLRVGQLEASAARQRRFRPMVITTRQAQARVVGTRFTLTANTNSTRLEVTEGKVRFTRLSDKKSVPVGAGHYAVAAAEYELAALPSTGSITREWWTRVKGNTKASLVQDPRFPDRPDKRDTAPDFELTIAETNQLAVRLCGYVHPPVTGDYRFWLERPPEDFAAVGYANLLMSPTESPSEAVQIAQTSAGGNLLSPYVAIGSTAAPPPIPLVAGKRYYLEARILIGQSKAELSVFWQPPGQSRRVLSGEFLSPWKPK